ncbi:single-stranded-DNA-specific exonuclease RecJ [Crocinitomicaceae bacterium]|nr:single-stranded-DNA-specific exonuclease RecJ [Crocinitomicaceae bacterium]|tara:strand:- start:1552 stop:3276 length:1725 start_codon:yes stop_codon:yes gene_type:complete
MQKKWHVKTLKDTTIVDAFRSKLKVDSIVAELLLQRGIDSFDMAQDFFRPKLDQLHDPFLMKDMEAAVDRLQEAIDEDQKVMLFGDYDVDGTTAVAMMYSFLKDTLKVDYYIPDRYAEGYGLSKQGIDVAKEHDVSLIICLDCGIKAVDKIAYAKSLGIDFIVCDHHMPGEELPDAIVLDPKRKDCLYPYDELSGCGVGFKLLQGMCEHNNWSTDKLFEHLDLLAVSIGADIVPVTGENRILCYHGMKQLNANPRVAFKELLTLANKQFPVTLTDVIFSIAPRINAAGRLRSGKHAVALMVSENLDDITSLADDINNDNLERRQLDQQITEEAKEIVEKRWEEKESFSNVVFKENWHKGVVGIVASRLIEKFYRPTIVLTESNGMVTGSARSIKDFNVYDALNACSEHLEQFGGHMYAAGMTLKRENLEPFMEAFEAYAKENLTSEMLIEEQEVDVELGFNQIFSSEENRMKIPKLKRILSQFEPHGPGNMKPVFISKNVFSTDMRLLKEAHIKLSMTQPEHDVVIEGIGFNQSESANIVAAGMPFDVVYTLESNKWMDRETLQLNIKDVRETV